MTTYAQNNTHGPPGHQLSPSKPIDPRELKRDSVQRRESVRSVPSSDELITYVFPDFNAVAYFQKDFVSSNEFFIMEETTVSGFDIYIVEQWVNSRKIGTVVATYTGDVTSQISVIKFTMTRKQSKYYPLRLQEYLNELMASNAKVKKMDEKLALSRANNSSSNLTTSTGPSSSSAASVTAVPNEVCFVTNLASLPSSLNLIPIHKGDVRRIQDDFIINSNLKKLQCCGRSLYLTTEKISDANEDKFRHMYKIDNDSIPIKFAIRELVNVIQTCLFYFDLLDAKYCDGLLCLKTEEAITNWWNFIGLPHFNVKPNPKSGILPARTVAAIISLILSVKLRLQLIGGCDVPKDPFDFENFMLSIGQFQRQYKLEKKRKLDLETLNKLFSITNTRLLPEKYRNSYPYSNGTVENFEDSIVQETGGIPTLSPNQHQHKKNKSYYGLEFKKLTNVVKSTVQDIQAASRDNLDMSNGKSSGGRIRNRIAKLADNITPLDVETLDLELLVRHYITGKTLTRLFYGVSNNLAGNQKTVSTEEKDYSHHQYRNMRHRHSHRNQGLGDNLPSRLYNFTSLKDHITYNQKTMFNGGTSDSSKYSRGINKMKMGLSNRRILGSNGNKRQPDPFPMYGREPGSPNNRELLDSSIVDSLLQPSIGGMTGSECDREENTYDHKSEISNKCNEGINHPLKLFQYNLNRRNSYPKIHSENLNSLEFSKKNIKVKRSEIHLLSRSLSCPNLDYNQVEEKNSPLTIEKFCSIYLSNVSHLLKYENVVNYFESEESSSTELCLQELPEFSDNLHGITRNQDINKKYTILNLELIKLRNIYQQINASKSKIVNQDLLNDLKYHINDLKSTIDRLYYETKIVVKRINELDEDSNLLDSKLNNQCHTKLLELINKLVSSKKFHDVFHDENERNAILQKLVGSTEQEQSQKCSDESRARGSANFLKIIVTFIYEMILFIFQLFKFDGSKMNLDRIRQSWGKLDPNRKLINRAYSYVGREPSRSSVSSIETLNE